MPSDGFECYYLLRDGDVVAEICGPQSDLRKRHLSDLVTAAAPVAGRAMQDAVNALEQPAREEVREVIASIIHRHVKSEADVHFVDRRWLVGVSKAAAEIAAALAQSPKAQEGER